MFHAEARRRGEQQIHRSFAPYGSNIGFLEVPRVSAPPREKSRYSIPRNAKGAPSHNSATNQAIVFLTQRRRGRRDAEDFASDTPCERTVDSLFSAPLRQNHHRQRARTATGASRSIVVPSPT